MCATYDFIAFGGVSERFQWVLASLYSHTNSYIITLLHNVMLAVSKGAWATCAFIRKKAKYEKHNKNKETLAG